MKLRARDKLEARITEAQSMLDDGKSVMHVAHKFGVSTQAVYAAIKAGRLRRTAAPAA